MTSKSRGGMICSVAICKSVASQAKQQGQPLRFFSFPKDTNVRKEWVRLCYRKDNFDPTNKRICSKHFVEQDYEDALKARLMNSTPKKLKPTALPSLYLRPVRVEESVSTSVRLERKKVKDRKSLVQEILATTSSISSPPNAQGEETTPLDLYTEPIPGTSSQSDEKYEILQRQFDQIMQENNELKGQIEDQNKQMTSLKQKIHELEVVAKNQDTEFHSRVKEIFADVLTPNQIDIALKKKTKARWTAEEIARAFTVRYFSKRAYIYMRQQLHYPLPGISTLQHWASNINLRSGILEDVLKLLEMSGSVKNEIDRATVLSFDEVKVTSTYEYDEKEDEVVGPHTYMQVIMARGLFDSWKQPVFIGFDTKMTKALLEDVITRLHNIKYNVQACVSDCGGGNQGLWKELGISIQKTYTLHPDTGEKIFMFADVPHLLKLMRNWFLDCGFILEDGTLINKSLLQLLVNAAGSEISSCHKLTTQHLTCEGVQRQNVALAAQLFSNTTAVAVKRYFSAQGKEEAEQLGDFISLVNNWFDLMNSYVVQAPVPTKLPYGKNVQAQDALLDKMKDVVGNMRCASKKSLQVFQKGILISSTSIQELFKHLQQKLNISYILTHRLNQDCLEIFFSQLRTRGGLHDHPSPLNALYRIRMILLGKNPGMVQSHSNVQQLPGEETAQYVCAEVLKKASVKSTVQEVGPIEEEFSDIASTSSTSSSHSLQMPSAEEDGLQYLAGYLAYKFKQEYPNLGVHTYKSNESLNVHSYSMPSWVQSLSYGGLTQPSAQWVEQCKQMEKLFKKLHKTTVQSGRKIVARTTLLISRRVDIPKKLIKAYVRQRIFIRIKYLNAEKLSKKRKAEDKGRKIVKKMKKITN